MKKRRCVANGAGISFISESGAKLQVVSQADPGIKLLPDSKVKSSRGACCFAQYQSNETAKFTDANHTIAHVLFSAAE